MPVLALTIQACTSTETRMREYISSSWERTIRINVNDDESLIGLPNPYTVPSPEGMFQEMYYWDTYFTNEGLIADGRVDLAKGNTENILYMVDRFGFMPNGSRTWYVNRSQPPFLSMMVSSIYKATGDKEWLNSAWPILEKEYAYWQEKHSTPLGLTRYSGGDAPRWLLDEFVITGGQRLGTDFLSEDLTQEEHDRIGRNLTAEAESGWDFNPRFDRRCEDFCPVDLNSLMYAFESNMAFFAAVLYKGHETVTRWSELADTRKSLMMEYLFDPDQKQFYDYDYVNGKRSDVVSAAVFSTLYTGLVDQETADGVAKALDLLEFKYGVSVCENKPYEYEYQWSYPNIWPPTTFMTVFGLDVYGYSKDARRIAKKYLRLVEKSWKETGRIWEKYDVVQGATSTSKEYETPEMLGWSAATYICFSEYLKN